ncbi:MAG TPA: lipid-binding SYLF domain-containing protein [Rhizomicrobium sp.]|nr:lipid-binding SYLF domain-containing protein [Rhizomicrobium sp.]
MYMKLTALLLLGCAMASGPAVAATARDARDAQTLVNESGSVLKTMEADPHMKALLTRAKGIFIVPEFGRGALIVGARGGSGLVMVKDNGHWSDPAFFGLGGISFGAQAGGSGGAIAMLLMTNKAVNDFRGNANFSLNAGAGLSIINYSANTQASWGKGDIVVWSDTGGAYAGATVSATDIGASTDDNDAYYHGHPAPGQILDGDYTNPKARSLTDLLPA